MTTLRATNSSESSENHTQDEEQRDGSDVTETGDSRRKSEKSENTCLSSTATTVTSAMASQWLNHMKRTFKRHAIALSEEQQVILKKMINDELYPQHASPEVPIRDIMMLYSRGLEALHDGRYRETFDRIRPCIPYLNTNVLVWIRISESLIFEFYEEVWEFTDIYTRLFERCPRRYLPSIRRRCNELRQRHEDMTIQYAELATLMMFSLAKYSIREPVHFAAASIRGFLLLKLKKYAEAIEVVDFVITKYDRPDEWKDNLSTLITYKAEGMLGIGRYNRAIEYCLRIIKETKSCRAKHRALMLIAMAYMRKSNFKKAHEYVLALYINVMIGHRLAVWRWNRSYTTAVANADVVVCGGGISGTSIAYHLAKRGKKVALVEKDSRQTEKKDEPSLKSKITGLFKNHHLILTIQSRTIRRTTRFDPSCFQHPRHSSHNRSQLLSTEFSYEKLPEHVVVQLLKRRERMSHLEIQDHWIVQEAPSHLDYPYSEQYEGPLDSTHRASNNPRHSSQTEVSSYPTEFSYEKLPEHVVFPVVEETEKEG
ncbi:hypothetical protein B9Z55_002003 [Caenorhabditis nigoni]|nr:hypothetical protein B9Z55_002003 [Caenorhabditis nigoni]